MNKIYFIIYLLFSVSIIFPSNLSEEPEDKVHDEDPGRLVRRWGVAVEVAGVVMDGCAWHGSAGPGATAWRAARWREV